MDAVFCAATSTWSLTFRRRQSNSFRNDDIQVISFPRRYQFLVAFNSQQATVHLGYCASRAERRGQSRCADHERAAGPRRGRRPAPSGPDIGRTMPRFALRFRSSRSPCRLLDSAGFSLQPAATPKAAPARASIHMLAAGEFQPARTNRARSSEAAVRHRRRHAVRGRSDSRNTTRDSRRTIRCSVHRYDQWTDARPGLQSSGDRRDDFNGLNVFGYENAEAERLFQLLRTSTNEAAVRSATAAAATSPARRSASAVPGLERARTCGQARFPDRRGSRTGSPVHDLAMDRKYR